jgi:hypothetical protein
VYYSSGPHLPTEVGSNAATCHTVPDLTSQLRWAPVLLRVLWLQTSPPGRGGLWHCHVSRGSQWVVRFKHKEKSSRSDYAARHACSQRTRAHFQGTSRRIIMRLQDVQADSIVNTCKVCGQTSTVRLQCDIDTMDHSSCTATVQSDSTV